MAASAARYAAGLRPVVLFLAVFAGLGTEHARAEAGSAVGQAFVRMYNFDFPGAHTILDREISRRPELPLPYSVKAAVYFFSELDRLKILQIDFFENDERVVDRRKLKPDPALRERMFRLIETARQRANSRLSSDSGDRDALFALCVAAGLVAGFPENPLLRRELARVRNMLHRTGDDMLRAGSGSQ